VLSDSQQAEVERLRALLRDCWGPLRVALSEFEEDERLAPKFSSLLKRIDVVLEGRDG
jgi:hypothetical protein